MASLPVTPTLLSWVAPQEALSFVQETFDANFPGQHSAFLDSLFGQIERLYAGRYPGYQASDSAYHGLTHTLEATVTAARLLDGHHRSQRPPILGARDFELTMAGILLHDSGFIKLAGDNEGTGAKYTLTHVARSAELAARFLPPLGVGPDEIRLVQLAIRCTAVNAVVAELAFRDEREHFIGCCLGTSDVLAQMAAPDYPHRLPALYQEYTEAIAYSGPHESGIANYTSAADLMRQTRQFYVGYVKRMLTTQWADVYRDLADYFPDHRNHYFEAIEANLARLDQA